MNILQNLVKGWITTVIGTVIIIVAVTLIVQDVMPLYWDGAGMMLIGAIFLVVPDKIGGIVDVVVKKKSE